MAERIARLGLMHYRDADGLFRDAWAGETIQVHPDYVELFDSLNVGPEPVPPVVEEEETVEEKPAPKRRGRPPKKAE